MNKILSICLCLILLLLGAFAGATFLSRKARAQGDGIIVDGEDDVSMITNEYSAGIADVTSGVTSRAVVEYADFGSKLELNKSGELDQATSAVSSRVAVEYADFSSNYESQSSDALQQAAASVTSRIVVEYADFIFSTGLGPKPMEDNTPPTTSISLNGVEGNNGWFTSNVTGTLSPTDDISGVDKTEYSFDNIAWTTYTTPFNITTEGNTVIYYHSKDKAGNVETTKIQTIKIDKTAPSGSVLVNNGDVYATSTPATLTLAASDATSGVYQVRFSNDGMWDTEPWETLTSTKTWTLMSGDGTKTVYYQIKDNAGLISITYSDIIILDTTPSTGSVSINDGATHTITTSVTLALSATDTTSGIAEMRFSNDNTTYTSWQTYTTSKPWALQEGDGTRTVYVQFRDQAGLISTYSDTIILDTNPPPAEVFPMWIIAAVIAAITIVAVATAVFWRRRKHLPTRN